MKSEIKDRIAWRRNTISFSKTPFECKKNSIDKNHKKLDLKICITLSNRIDSIKTKVDTTTKLSKINLRRINITRDWITHHIGNRS